jgi:hypothetical protein
VGASRPREASWRSAPDRFANGAVLSTDIVLIDTVAFLTPVTGGAGRANMVLWIIPDFSSINNSLIGLELWGSFRTRIP